MIRFIDNQFLGETEDGPHRSRLFEIHEAEYRNVGMITALPLRGLLRIVTTAPVSEYVYKDDAEVVDQVVNRAEKAAHTIARLLNLSDDEYEFGRSA